MLALPLPHQCCDRTRIPTPVKDTKHNQLRIALDVCDQKFADEMEENWFRGHVRNPMTLARKGAHVSSPAVFHSPPGQRLVGCRLRCSPRRRSGQLRRPDEIEQRSMRGAVEISTLLMESLEDIFSIHQTHPAMLHVPRTRRSSNLRRSSSFDHVASQGVLNQIVGLNPVLADSSCRTRFNFRAEINFHGLILDFQRMTVKVRSSSPQSLQRRTETIFVLSVRSVPPW